jgi:hypothetical protein
MLDEYDFSGGVRGKYAKRYREIAPASVIEVAGYDHRRPLLHPRLVGEGKRHQDDRAEIGRHPHIRS